MKTYRISGISGTDIVIGPDICQERILIFFCGDIQNFKDEMVLFKKWNINSTYLLLNKKIPQNYSVLVIRASHLKDETAVAHYQNFLGCSDNISPIFITESPICITRIHSLVTQFLPLNHLKELKLAFFSKGGTVLTKLMHEVFSSSLTEPLIELCKIIRTVYALDLGHQYSNENWPLLEEPLPSFFRPKFIVHATGFQIANMKQKPHNGISYAKFKDWIKMSSIHFEIYEEVNKVEIRDHFDIIDKFSI